MPYKLNGYRKGSGENVYTPPDSTARYPSLHTLDITETFVRLVEGLEPGMTLRFDPEPWAHTTYGGHKVTPDAYVRLPGRHFWLEVDRNSEAPSVISAKMNRYVSAFHGLDGGSFPLVIWLAHDSDRVRTLEREAKKKSEPGIFQCLLFDNAVGLMIGG